MTTFHDEIEIEDMEYDEETETYYYPCPCGDRFQITKVSSESYYIYHIVDLDLNNRTCESHVGHLSGNIFPIYVFWQVSYPDWSDSVRMHRGN